MALTKVNRGGLNTGISDSSDATFLTATSSEGVTFAGTLAVTGVHTVGPNAVATSDGGAVTTSIIQGLAKVWIQSAANGTSITDSLNVSSLGDTATGQQTVNINNDMSNDDYATAAAISDAGQFSLATASLATGSFVGYYFNIGGNGYHDGIQKHAVFGDLA